MHIMSKVPKKKESKDQVGLSNKDGLVVQTTPHESESRSAKRKTSVPMWCEWSDQDISNEKWDTGKKERERGRSPNSQMNYFDDPDGKVELPESLRAQMVCWKRPSELFDDKNVSVVDTDQAKCADYDLITPNEKILESEFIRWFVSSIATLSKALSPAESNLSNALKTKVSQREQKEVTSSKNEKVKRDADVVEDTGWKPWHHIWPKESSKSTSLPVLNLAGKYAVKLFWMGCWRKIIIDDSIPCNHEGASLLPFSGRSNDLWPALLCKALMKIASLDYPSGSPRSEFGELSIIQCLTGWIPEPIPLKVGCESKVWELLLRLLPRWTFPLPPKAAEEEGPADSGSTSPEESKKSESSRPDLNVKDSKQEARKENSGKNKDKAKPVEKEKVEKEMRKDKDKEKGPSTSSAPLSSRVTAPEMVLLVSFSKMSSLTGCFSDLRSMSDASENLRRHGLSHNLSHLVHLRQIRNCPLVPPPVPLPIPRWKLIRQKKRVVPLDPPVNPPVEKEPKFLEMASPFYNYLVSPTPVSKDSSPRKRDKFLPTVAMTSVDEEDDAGLSYSLQDGSAENPSQLQEPNTIKQDRRGADVKKDQPDAERPDKNPADGKKDVAERKMARSPSVLSHGSQKSSKSLRLSKASKLDAREGKKMGKDAKELDPKKLQMPQNSTPESYPAPDAEEGTDPSEGCAVVDNKEADALQAAAEEEKAKKCFWMHFDDVCYCFNTLWIFHAPSSYAFSKGLTELKSLEPKSDKPKKLGATVSTNMSTPGGRNSSMSPSSASVQGLSFEPPPPLLFVDNTESTELLISLSSISRWFDANLQLGLQGKEDREEQLRQLMSPTPGVLLVEPYTWKRLVTGSPILAIRTTSCKGAVVTLPPGRHVLRLIIQTPFGHHVQVCSKTPFVLGDEDTIMQHLSKESTRFIAHSLAVVKSLGLIIASFSDAGSARRTDLVIGSEDEDNATRQRHFESLFTSFNLTARGELGDGYTSRMSFALHALKFEAYLRLRAFRREPRKPRTLSEAPSTIVPTPSIQDLSPMQRPISLPAHLSLVPSMEDEAASKIQAAFRGYFTRKLRLAKKIGSVENAETVEDLNRIWQSLEPKLEAAATRVYRSLFTRQPSLMQVFPFSSDEWNKISYADYSGSYSDQPANCWFVMCRAVFHVVESVLFFPKLHAHILTCTLRVVNNDTGEELKKVFEKVAPQVLRKNRFGYTFVVEGKTPSVPVPSGKFRLRLIGDREPLPLPSDGAINTSFAIKEIREYYVPNRYKILFRYTVKALEKICASIQLGTSKDDVYVKLQVLDGDEELASRVGKGHVVIPCFFFLKDRTLDTGDEEGSKSSKESRSGSARSASKGSSAGKRSSGTKRSASPEKQNRKAVKDKPSYETITLQDVQDGCGEVMPEAKVYKYVIQAQILGDSWPLSQRQWEFIEELKIAEKAEAETLGESEAAAKPETTSKGSAGKGRKQKEARDSKGIRSRPESQNQQVIDDTKPHWSLKLALDAAAEALIEIRKDTERQDEIKAMKLAWEAAEPGRADKAQKSRLKFVERNTIMLTPVEKADVKAMEEKAGPLAGVERQTDRTYVETSMNAADIVVTDSDELTIDPPKKDVTSVLKYFDVSPYIRSSGVKVYLDRSEERRMEVERAGRFAEFQSMRDKVLQDRERDRLCRNSQKEQQLAEYDQMQCDVDAARTRWHEAREAYRQRFLKKPEEPAVIVPEGALSSSPKHRASKMSKESSRVGSKVPPAKAGKKK